MEVTTALIPSELLARYDALPFDGTHKKAEDTLSTLLVEALAAVVNAATDQEAWQKHCASRISRLPCSRPCRYCPDSPNPPLASRFTVPTEENTP